MSNLKDKFEKEIAPLIKKEANLRSELAVPRIKSVVVNMGIGKELKGGQSKEIIERASEDLAAITGQKPQVRLAKRSIAGFGLRKGSPVGLRVTLRGDRMYDFLEKLFSIVLPRIRDFRGLSPNSFDGRGNYSLGLNELTVFPEIDLGKIDRIRGLEITIITTAGDDATAKNLLEKMGMPFAKEKS